MTEFEFAALDFVGRNGINKWTTCSISFGKIISSIYTDCDYLNNKLYFLAICYFFSTIFYIFLMNSNGFMRVQVRVQKKYFFEFKFECSKMIEFF